MPKKSNSAHDATRLSQVLAAYMDEADSIKEDAHKLNSLRERYLKEHLELAPELELHFENEDAIGWCREDIQDSLPDFDRYTSVTRIGQGAMGVVYKAFDQELKRWVALKMSPPIDPVTIRDTQRFRMEAQSMARLRHPNIVRVFDVKEYKGRPFLSMELMQGGSLDQHLDRFIGAQSSAVKLMTAVARAVHHAHQRGILHRDLKPSNILLDSDEHALDKPHVSDFGLAKPIDGEEQWVGRGVRSDTGMAKIGKNAETPDQAGKSMRSTASSGANEYGKVVGTASYMSPEQARGEKASTLSDVYGLGAVLYALLTGCPPFRGGTVNETLQLVTDPEKKPAPPSKMNPNVDKTLDAICLRCIESDPYERYGSAEGLANDLDRWLSRLPTEARLLSGIGRMRLWCRRNPLKVGSAALLFLLMALAAVNIADRLQEPGRSQAALARQGAAAIHIRLRQMIQAVTAASEHPQLGKMLTTRDFVGLQSFIENTGSSLTDLDGQSPFESWFIIDNRDGYIVARWPEMSPLDENVDFRSRDYYLGALRPANVESVPSVYVSRVFGSLSDEMYKFGLSAVLRDGEKVAGIIVASVTTSRRMGLPDEGSNTFVTALLARRDPFLVPEEPGTPEEASDFLILLHPAYERGMAPVWFPRRYAEVLPNGSLDDYVDPVASHGDSQAQEYSGPWKASFAGVLDSEFIVLIQQRYPAPVPIKWWVALSICLAGILIAVAIKYFIPEFRRAG